MKRILKWAGIGAASLIGLVALAVAGVLIASQVILDRTHPTKPSTVHAAAGPEAVARGAHLVDVGTCRDCHGKDLTGKQIDALGSKSFFPNLTVLARSLTDADIDHALRQGVRPDGKSVLIMPSHDFANLTDDEVASVIAYLRTLAPLGVASPAQRLGLLPRAALVMGKFRPETAQMVGSRPPLDVGPRFAAGRHLAGMICANCHGTDLAGEPKNPATPGTPDLTIAAAYDRDAFHTLMRTGKAAGGREVGEMSQTARSCFSHFTDAEIDAIYDYLGARGRAVAAGPGSRAAAGA